MLQNLTILKKMLSPYYSCLSTVFSAPFCCSSFKDDWHVKVLCLLSIVCLFSLAASTASGGGYRSPSSLSAMGQGDPRGGANYGGSGYKELRRTPSTSAIYETLRRSKELRESLSSRPSSRLSLRGDSTVLLCWRPM